MNLVDGFRIQNNAVTHLMSETYVRIPDLPCAQRALDAARKVDELVTLLSAPGAAAYLGPGWFVQMLAQLGDAERAALAGAYLDCGPRPGDVLAAFRAGVPGVIFTGRGDVADKLRALAQAHRAAFRTDRPAALDLLEVPDPGRAVAAYLQDQKKRGR